VINSGEWDTCQKLSLMYVHRTWVCWGVLQVAQPDGEGWGIICTILYYGRLYSFFSYQSKGAPREAKSGMILGSWRYGQSWSMYGYFLPGRL
jgi:hypothetical protein